MAEQLPAGVLPDGAISEWRPSRATLMVWTILSVPITAIGFIVYMGLALRGDFPYSATIALGQIILVSALTLGLAWVHEGVHGIAIFAFGAKAEFGVLKIGGILAGFYTTAPGHRFSRRQYLIVALAPLAVLAPLGVPACLLPFGAYLAVPFAVHLAGCIGDVTIALQVLRAGRGVMCEDLRDGTRFWKAEA